MKQLSEKQEKILKRRKEISEMIASKSEKEISISLGVSLRTIVGDVGAIKRSTMGWVDNLPKYIVLHKFKTALENSDVRRKTLEKALPNASNIFEVVTIIKELRAEDEFSIELLGKSPTIYALKLAMERANVHAS